MLNRGLDEHNGAPKGALRDKMTTKTVTALTKRGFLAATTRQRAPTNSAGGQMIK